MTKDRLSNRYTWYFATAQIILYVFTSQPFAKTKVTSVKCKQVWHVSHYDLDNNLHWNVKDFVDVTLVSEDGRLTMAHKLILAVTKSHFNYHYLTWSPRGWPFQLTTQPNSWFSARVYVLGSVPSMQENCRFRFPYQQEKCVSTHFSHAWQPGPLLAARGGREEWGIGARGALALMQLNFQNHWKWKMYFNRNI